MGLEHLLDVLRCPICAGQFHAAETALRCGGGHAFDIAKQGYVNLLTGSATAGTADTATMVAARAEFLAAGHYAPLAEAIATHAAPNARNAVLDAGAGTGYYLARVLDRAPGFRGLALDVSKFAARRAARSHPRVAAAVSDTWQPLPVRDGAVDVLLNVFAPRNGPEFRRVLNPNGCLLVVTPTARHLAELVDATGMLTVDARKEERLERSLAGEFAIEHREELTFPLSLTPADVERVIRMGPSAWHLGEPELSQQAAARGTAVKAIASVTVTRYRALP